jgi:hypothetical protein
MTPEQKADIDGMSQIDMARLVRFAEAGHPYFVNHTDEVQEYFASKFNGFTPEISKAIGWGKNETEI